MIILGVDPGTATTGYGALEYTNGNFHLKSCGCIMTSSQLSLSKRLQKIYHEVLSLAKTLKPDEIVVEELFFNLNVQTAMTVGQARGVILLAAAEANVQTYEYTPLQVKLAVVGYGRARKEQVQFMVKTILGLKETPKPDDIADALALAICHAHNRKNYEKPGGDY